MITLLNHKDPYVSGELVELQRRSYQLEADILGVTCLPPLEESKEDIQNSEEHFIGEMSNDKMYGFASYECLADSYLITRLGVDPDYLRRGIGGSMIKYFEDRAMYPLEVITGKDNTPAVNLYQKYGFKAVSYAETNDGIWLVKLRKDSRDPS